MLVLVAFMPVGRGVFSAEFTPLAPLFVEFTPVVPDGFSFAVKLGGSGDCFCFLIRPRRDVTKTTPGPPGVISKNKTPGPPAHHFENKKHRPPGRDFTRRDSNKQITGAFQARFQNNTWTPEAASFQHM